LGTLRRRAPRRQIEAIEAILTTDVQTGTAGLKGTAHFRNIPFRMLARMDRLGVEAPARFSVTIDVGGSTGRLAAAGQLDWDRRSAEGTIHATAPDAKALIATVAGGDAVAVAPWDVAAEGRFSADGSNVALTDLELAYGEVRGTGQARLSMDNGPALDARLVIGSVDLDRLAAATAGDRPAERRPVGPRLTSGLFGPELGLAADLNLTVKAARWRDGVIRDIGADIRLGSHGPAIDRLAMKLPGGTDVTLSGMERGDEPAAPLQGDIAVISDNLRSTLIWAGTASEQLPSDRLRSLSLTSRIAVTADAVHLANIAARLDATRMTGAATIARQARPSFGLRLDLDHIDLDAYLPESMRREAETGADVGMVFREADLFDANLVLSAKTLTLGSRTASLASLDARLFDGNILVRNLSVGELDGAAFTVSGTIADAAGTATGDLNFAVQARDAERFVGLMNLQPGAIASRIGGFRLDAHVSGTADRAAVSGALTLAGGKVRAKGTLTGLNRGTALELALAVNHPDGDRVLNLLAPERPYGGIGAMSMTFDLASSADSVAIRNLDAALGDMAISGRIDVAYGGIRPSAVAVLSAGDLDIDRLLPAPEELRDDSSLPARRGSAHWSRQPIDLSVLRSLDLDLSLRSDTARRGTARLGGLELHAGLSDGVLTMDRLTGTLFGGSFEATARIDAADSGPSYAMTASGHDLAARTAIAAIARIDRLKGPLTFALSLSATGHTPYDLASTLSGGGTLSGTLQALRHGIEPIPAGAAGDAMEALLKAFSSAPAELSGSFRVTDGNVQTTDLRLDGDDVRALTSGTADISDWRIQSTTTMVRAPAGDDSPDLLVKLSGPIDAPAVNLSGPAATGDTDGPPIPESAPVMPVEPLASPLTPGQGAP